MSSLSAPHGRCKVWGGGIHVHALSCCEEREEQQPRSLSDSLCSYTHRVMFSPPDPWPFSALRAGAKLLLSTHMYFHVSQPSSRMLVMCVGRHMCMCPERLSLHNVLNSLNFEPRFAF